MTAVDELVKHCKDAGLRRSASLTRFCRFHRHNPVFLDFVLQELALLKRNGWNRTSFESLGHYARWCLTFHRVPGETFAINQNLMPHYGRVVMILHPEFNGFFKLKRSQADRDFGVRISKTKSASGLCGIEWSDGTPIESGWRPSVPHVIPENPVPRRPPVER